MFSLIEEKKETIKHGKLYEKNSEDTSATKKPKLDSSNNASATPSSNQEIILLSPEPKHSTPNTTLSTNLLPNNKTEVFASDDSKLFHRIAIIYTAKIKFDKTKVDYVYKLDESRNKSVTVVKIEIALEDDLSVETLISHLADSINKGWYVFILQFMNLFKNTFFFNKCK